MLAVLFLITVGCLFCEMASSSPSLPKPSFAKGVVLGHREREIIYNVYSYFTREKENKKVLHSIDHVIARTVDATGIWKSTITRIIARGTDFATPGKERKRGRKPKLVDRCVIHRVVHSFFREKRLPTRQSIVTELAKKPHDILIKKETLRKL